MGVLHTVEIPREFWTRGKATWEGLVKGIQHTVHNTKTNSVHILLVEDVSACRHMHISCETHHLETLYNLF